MEYRIKNSPELSGLSFLYHIDTVKISRMIDAETAKVYDTHDGIEFTINIKYLVPASA